MIKKASFFSPSTAPRNVGIRSSSGLGDSPIFWMRSVCDGGAVSILAARSLKECQNVVLKISSFGSWKGLPGQICLPLKGKDAQRVLWVAQLSSSSLKYSSRGRRTPRITMVKVGVSGLNYNTLSEREQAASSTEGPSCIYVGPLEKAEKARLEALYQQARDSYYSGRPLIVDDMFDRVETMLRWHGSKVILKYPRCSLKRYSAYADAEIDASQMWALASIWGLLLASGIFAAAGPPACAINQACKKSVHLRFESHGVSAASETVMYMNGLLAISMGLVIGIPVAMAAARSLQGLWRGDLVAMKGCCPSCGEEVYAFVRADQSGQPQHKTECHVCEHPLMFRANVERSSSHPGHFWAYGRVYLSTQSKDLSPNGSKF